MGLFNRKKNTTPVIKPSKEKAIYEYKMMEQVNCDLDAALSNPNPGFMDFCKIIAENDKYRFCSYKAFKDNSGGYVIRQNKANPAEKLFFGENFQMACIYKSYLFQSGHSGERGRFYIFAKNIETGNVVKCDWLGKGDVFVNINGYGRFYVQDTINDFGVENDELVFHIKREKSNNETPLDKYDIDTEYILKVTIENGQFKPVAIFNVETAPPKKNDSTKETEHKESKSESKSKNNSGLGRDEDKHISCDFEGHEDDCPKDCNKCAISIKTDGDIALAQNDLELAIKQYRKAVFVEPKFAEAWVNMGNAYGMRSEYNNAISAFNKAIAIDPTYGKALFGKAITLRNQGSLDEAMALANEILELYDDDSVEEFKKGLVKAGVKDKSTVYSLEKVIDLMTDEAYELIDQNNLLDADGNISTEHEICCKEAFARSIFAYCKKRYNSLGNDKIWSESIISAFYGSICTTLLYYSDSKGFEDVEPFEYLRDHVDIDELERNAEKLLNIRQSEEKIDELWNLIYSFVTSCKKTISKLEDSSESEAAVIDASESAYIMGMLFAMRHNEKKQEKRASLDDALKKLADSTKDYNYTPPERSAMCYSIRMPEQGPVYYRCMCCGKTVKVDVDKEGGKEQQTFDGIFEKYKALARKFTELGYPSEVKRVCDDCAKQKYPSFSLYHTNNMVFSLTRKDCGKIINSYPALSWLEETPYKIALAFLNGADTLQKLSEATDTQLSADDYLKHIHNVLGDVSSRIR